MSGRTIFGHRLSFAYFNSIAIFINLLMCSFCLSNIPSLLAGTAKGYGERVPAASVQGRPNTLALQFEAGETPVKGGAASATGAEKSHDEIKEIVQR